MRRFDQRRQIKGVKQRVSWGRGWQQGPAGVITGSRCQCLRPAVEGWILRLMTRHEGLENVRSNTANSGDNRCHLEHGMRTTYSQLFTLSSVVELIWPQSMSCQEISDIHSLHGSTDSFIQHEDIPVSFWQSDYDCSVKWRTCDHCAATNALCGRSVGLWADAVAEGTDQRQQRWLIRKQDRQKKLKAVPGVLPPANGAGHMLYRLIVLLHSLLVTLFLRQRSNQNNPNQSGVCLQFSRRKEEKRVAEISRFHLVPHSLFKHPIKWKLNWLNRMAAIQSTWLPGKQVIKPLLLAIAFYSLNDGNRWHEVMVLYIMDGVCFLCIFI